MTGMGLGAVKLVIKSVVLLGLAVIAAGILYWIAFASQWSWIATYWPLLLKGLWLTIVLLVVSVAVGGLLAIPIGFVQVTGPAWLAAIARAFCTVIRGTPLLVQLWLIYYGFGSLFPQIGLAFPDFKQDFMWLIRLDAFWYATAAFTLSFAGYEGEVMRGAFLGVPRGELEAARAIGMPPSKVLSRVWFPRAVRLVLPTLAGETVLQLKATPLAFTVTVMDLMGVTSKIRQDTFRIFEPLMLLAVIYMTMTFIIVYAFRLIENMVPQKR
jgi:polar amino acid transport system permease protein